MISPSRGRRRGRRAARPRRGSASSAGSSCRASGARGSSPTPARRAAGSKPVVGSSRKISSGLPISASPRSSRRFWPPESVRARASAFSVRPTISTTSSTSRGAAVVAGEEAQALARRSGSGRATTTGGRRRCARARPCRRAAGPRRAPRPRRRLGCGSPRGSRRWSSCRRRSGRAGRTPRRLPISKSIPRTASCPP